MMAEKMASQVMPTSWQRKLYERPEALRRVAATGEDKRADNELGEGLRIQEMESK